MTTPSRPDRLSLYLQEFRIASSSSSPVSIPARWDRKTSDYVVLWNDVLQIFQNAKSVSLHGIDVEFLPEGNNQRKLMPLRIRHRPKVVLEISESDEAQRTTRSGRDTPAPDTASVVSGDWVVLPIAPMAPIEPLNQSPRHQSPQRQSRRTQSPQSQSPQSQSPRHQSPRHQSPQRQPSQSPSHALYTNIQQYGPILETMIPKQPMQDLRIANFLEDLWKDACRQIQQTPQDEEMENMHMLETLIEQNQPNLELNVFTMQQLILDSKQGRLDHLASLQDSLETFTSLAYVLRDKPVPRLFVVLPKASVLPMEQELSCDDFRLYFICECSRVDAAGEIHGNIHLARHKGYDLKNAQEFFEAYGPYVQAMYHILENEINAPGIHVPSVTLLELTNGVDEVQDSIDLSTYDLEILMHKMIRLIVNLNSDDRDGIAKSMREIVLETLELADLQHLVQYLDGCSEDEALGNLRQCPTKEGGVRWVCADHYCTDWSPTLMRYERRREDDEDSCDPDDTDEDPGDPDDTDEDPGDPGDTHEDPGDPGDTHEDPGDPDDTDEDPGDPDDTDEDPDDSDDTDDEDGHPPGNRGRDASMDLTQYTHSPTSSTPPPESTQQEPSDMCEEPVDRDQSASMDQIQPTLSPTPPPPPPESIQQGPSDMYENLQGSSDRSSGHTTTEAPDTSQLQPSPPQASILSYPQAFSVSLHLNQSESSSTPSLNDSTGPESSVSVDNIPYVYVVVPNREDSSRSGSCRTIRIIAPCQATNGGDDPLHITTHVGHTIKYTEHSKYVRRESIQPPARPAKPNASRHQPKRSISNIKPILQEAVINEAQLIDAGLNPNDKFKPQHITDVRQRKIMEEILRVSANGNHINWDVKKIVLGDEPRWVCDQCYSCLEEGNTIDSSNHLTLSQYRPLAERAPEMQITLHNSASVDIFSKTFPKPSGASMFIRSSETSRMTITIKFEYFSKRPSDALDLFNTLDQVIKSQNQRNLKHVEILGDLPATLDKNPPGPRDLLKCASLTTLHVSGIPHLLSERLTITKSNCLRELTLQGVLVNTRDTLINLDTLIKMSPKLERLKITESGLTLNLFNNLQSKRLKPRLSAFKDLEITYTTGKEIQGGITTYKHPKPISDKNSTSSSQEAEDPLVSYFDEEPDLKWQDYIMPGMETEEDVKRLAADVFRAFLRDGSQNDKAVAEVVLYAHFFDEANTLKLLDILHKKIRDSMTLEIYVLDGIARLIQDANPRHFNAEILITTLELIIPRLRERHPDNAHIYHSTSALTRIMDAIVDAEIAGLARKRVSRLLASLLNSMERLDIAYFVYQAAYVRQALLCIPDTETTHQGKYQLIWKANQRAPRLERVGIDLSKADPSTIGFVVKLKMLFPEENAGLSEGIQASGAARTPPTPSNQDVEDFIKSLKKDSISGRKRAWYSALRRADASIRKNDLTVFRDLVCWVSCRRHPAFQWGLCQRLGEIAVTPFWEPDERLSAISFLGEIYQRDIMYGQQTDIKKWCIRVLLQASLSSDDDIQSHAKKVLHNSEESGDEIKQALYRMWSIRKNPNFYPLNMAPPEPASPCLADHAKQKPEVESDILLLRRMKLESRSKNTIYIPLEATTDLQRTLDARFPLMLKVKESLDNKQKVFLLRGDSGAGKSMFGKELEFELWNTHNDMDPIPLYIDLPTLKDPEQRMVHEHLRNFGFTEFQIQELKRRRKFILICDGYEELQGTPNLYTTNKLNQPGEWSAQMVITCCTECLGAGYRGHFIPGGDNRYSSLLQEAVIAPFSWEQAQDYIKKYVSVRKSEWDAMSYKEALERVPGLMDLTSNPFLMTLMLEALPRTVGPKHHLSTITLSRVVLYDQFMEQWLERCKIRIMEDKTSPQSRAAYKSMESEGFMWNGNDFLKRLASAIYKEQDGKPVVRYSRKDGASWMDEFFGEDGKYRIPEAYPLTKSRNRSGDQYRFIHRSLLEYELALAIFDPQDRETSTASTITSRPESESGTTIAEGSFNPFEVGMVDEIDVDDLEINLDDLEINLDGLDGWIKVPENPFPTPLMEYDLDTPVLVFEDMEDETETDNTGRAPKPRSPLVWRNFVRDPVILQFLKERARQELEFRRQLHEYIRQSKTDKTMSTAAANAITILVGAGENFVDADLQGIRIPGADISYGVFDSAKLQGADLKKVNLRGAWLSQADLHGAEMEGAEFGEQPFLTENTGVCSCAYSPDGKSFAIGLETGGIALYTTSNWETSGTFPGHENKVQSIVYTSKGDQFASVSSDRLIVWNVRTVKPRIIANRPMGCSIAFSPQGDHIVCNYYHDTTVPILHTDTGDSYRILKGHTKRVTSVAYSPKYNQVASGSKDTTIRLWSVETSDCIHVLKTEHKVLALAYSPAGDFIASGGEDKAIQLWDLDTGVRRHVLKGHIDSISSVTFSFQGYQIASGDKSGRVRLWDAKVGASLCTISDHDREVSSVAYSPRGGLVTCSKNKTVRLWNVSAKTSSTTGVYSIQCSPKGDQFASGGSDCTIRLWDAETGSCQLIMRGHENMVASVAYSPDGNRLVSGSEDNSVCLWDVKTGGCIQPFSGHNSKVNSVAYSPHGDTVVSGSSDATVRLWHVSNGDYLKLTGHTQDVLSVAYSPDNGQIASGSMDSTVRLWNVRTGTCDRELKGHSGGVRSVVYSPKGTQLASASDDMTARLWDVDTGTCTWTSTGHFGEVVSVVFSPDGERLASGSLDRTVQIWNVATGQSISVIDSFQEPVRSIAWNTVPETQLPHRNYLVTGCGDGSMLMWEVTELQEMCRVRPRWSVNGALNVKGAIVQDVLGLTPLNKQLLKQREAVGEPAHSLLRRS
ncbi:hypothetical protein BGX31_002604 [Mortierella sp. GBA43]|nr:hypothetical protein BGX31_002604 [Mortierella sp. GBA43]